MLLREDGDAVVCIGQASHAWLSGQLARAWGGEAVRPLEPREELCLAAEQHDVGMATWDLAPALHPETGRPRSFLEMELAVHLRLWTAAPERLLTQSRYAALLVSRHGTILYGRSDLATMAPERAEPIRAFLAEGHALQARLAASLGVPDDELDRNGKLVFAWDWLSLALCLGWGEGETPLVPLAAGDGRLRYVPTADGAALDPWPFAVPSVTVFCEGRRLEGRYEDEAALHRALAAAPVVRPEFRLTGTDGPASPARRSP
ncbi:MAG: hypothetical protein QOG77_2669 [Solirubrobacteraceae bacterium]|nr:hypothetical protein [Solirubrobacteraceae bacterium]